MSAEREAEVEFAISSSTGQRLLRAARLLDEAAVSRIRGLPGAPPIRPAHTRLFPHITTEGRRSTEIAQRIGISKQAVANLVADLVSWGVVEQVPDPQDGRARLVRWTSTGREAILHGLGVLRQFEAELQAEVGSTAFKTFHDVLGVLVKQLETGEEP